MRIPTLVFCLNVCAVCLSHAALVGHWDIEEGAGSTTADQSLGAHHLDLEPNPNGPSWSAADLPPVGSGTNASIRFDGTDDRLVAAGYKVPEISGTNPRTMAAWVKAAPGAPNNMGIIAYGADVAGQKWILRSQETDGAIDGNLRVEVNGGYVTSTAIITDGSWHHVAATFEDDGSPDVLDVLLYVDGVLQTNDAMVDEPINTNTTAGIDLRIGDDHSNRKWSGWIDEVRIYDEALDAAAILALATDPPIITRFGGDAEAVASGGSVDLSWIVDEEFDTLTIDNGVGDVADDTTNGTGEIAVSPIATTTYTLTGTRDGEALSREFLVLVDQAPVIDSFSFEGPSTIGFGQTVTLSWSVYGESSVDLTTVGDVTGQSQAMVTPAGVTTYTLSATNAFGTSTAEVTLSALPAGTPDLAWNAVGFPDGPLAVWEPSGNLTPNDGIIFISNTGETVESGASNFGSVFQWVNSPGYNLSGNPLDSWQDGLGNPATQENVSWELVFRPGDFTGTHTLFNTGGNGDGTAITLVGSSLDFVFQDANADAQRVRVSADLSAIGAATEFYHVVAVADVDTAANGTGWLYVNGILVDGPVTSTGTINDWDGGDLAELGKGNNIPAGNPFNPDAFTGDIAAFNYHAGKLLSADLIAKLYNRHLLQPIVASFETDTPVAAAGEDITLSWEVDEDFEGLVIDNGVGDVSGNTNAGEGSIVVNPSQTTTYVLTGTRDGDFQTAEVTVLIGVAPIISAFEAAGTNQIPTGGTADLEWDTFGADSVEISPAPGVVAERGTVEVSPAATQTYTLTATNAFGSSTADVVITVREGVLIARYSFTTEPNPTLIDESGNGNEIDLTFGATTPTWLSDDAGRQGVLSFDDSAGGFAQLVAPAVTPTAFEGFTVMVWAKSDLTTQGQFGTLFANGQGAGNHFQIDSDGAGNWRVRDSGSVNTPFGPIVADEWTHLALTWDGNTRTLYYNGAAVSASQVDPGSVFDEYRISMNRANDANGPVDAEIDDLRIYDFALSAAGILKAMNESGSGPTLAFTNIEIDTGADTVTLTWSSLPGKFYSVDFSTNLRQGDWLEVTDSWESGGAETTFVHPSAGIATKPELFYRVRED